MVRDDIVKHIDKLPGFSVTVTKVISLSNNLKSSPKDLIHAISLDPSLTAKVLSLINSAYFGMREPVLSLNRAVILLGINTIKNAALGSAVLTTLKIRNDFKWFTAEEFWEHSLGVAVGAKILAQHIGISMQERDEYFIAGLLHDMGKVIFVQHAVDDYSRIADPSYRPELTKTEVETKMFGISHPELGELIAKKWELPPQLAQTIGQHHSPLFTGEETDKVKAAVQVADYWCNFKEIGTAGKVALDSLSPEVWAKLNVKSDQLETVFVGLEKMVGDAKVFLKN